MEKMEWWEESEVYYNSSLEDHPQCKDYKNKINEKINYIYSNYERYFNDHLYCYLATIKPSKYMKSKKDLKKESRKVRKHAKQYWITNNYSDKNVELYIKQYINDNKISFIAKIGFLYNFFNYCVKEFLWYDRNPYTISYCFNFKINRSRKEIYKYWIDVISLIRTYCEYKSIDINFKNNRFIFVLINNDILN